MGENEQSLGLRDRKKIKTRDAIRRAALRLFQANGYGNTTIEQIAEAADIAPSTFFRYFATKESVLIMNDLDQVTIDALAQQPEDVPTLQAFRRALDITLATVSADEWQFERARIRLVLSVPELKVFQFDEYHRTVARLAEAEAARLGRDRNDFEVRALVGALAGALMAVIDQPSGVVQRMYRTLDFVEAGLTSSPD
jgi:AcrR family transcriptional regulator